MLNSSPDSLRNVEAEAALLGALMIDNRLVEPVADMLGAADFSEDVYRRVFESIVREVSSGRAASPVTLRPFFVDDHAMIALGGPGHLAQLTGSGAGMIGARDFAQQIGDLGARRRLVEGLDEVRQRACDPSVEIETLLSEAEIALGAADRGDEGIREISGAVAIDYVLETAADSIRGVRTGLEPLDELIGPMLPGQMIVLAARPGQGKTATALSASIGAARAGHSVFFVSLEMSGPELGARMAADLCFAKGSGISFDCIRDRRLNIDQARAVARVRGEMAELSLTIVDPGSLRLSQLRRLIRRQVRRAKARGGALELVVIDYLQLLQPEQRGRSTYETVSEISRGLKTLAKDQNIAILALAQLSREVEKRPDRRPNLSDLRDSGQIEQDADAVVMLMRPDTYLQQAEPKPGTVEHAEWSALYADLSGQIEFICAKRRNGRIGTRKGTFFAAYQAVRGAQ